MIREHAPKPGRIAFICEHKDHRGIPLRRFVKADDLEPECERHGKMKIQANKPYMGTPIPAAV